MSEPVSALNNHAAREKNFVALSSVIAAVVLTSVKIIVGISTNSLGVLSEAAHSGLDLVAAGVTLFAVRVSSRPADREHPYGHGKVENISALFETLLLLVTCVWIVYEAVERLWGRPVHVDPSMWAFATMGLSIVIDVSRSRALARVAKKHHSQALEADALHFSTDVWSSAVVILGLILVRVGNLIDVSWLAQADAVAAVAVAGIVVWVSLRLGKKSVDDLIDAVPGELQDRARGAALIEGVSAVKQARLRRSGPQIFADLTLNVARDTAFEQAHDIADRAEAAVRQALPGTDVVIHIEPVASDNEDLLTTIRLVAARLGHGAHAVRVYDHDGATAVELHLEVMESLSLQEAHDRATAFETSLRQAVGSLGEIVTHIEPAGVHSATRIGEPVNCEAVVHELQRLRHEQLPWFEPHHVTVWRNNAELDVSFHCVMDASTSITDAHAVTEQIEKTLRLRVPNIGRVLIHVEPPDVDHAHDSSLA